MTRSTPDLLDWIVESKSTRVRFGIGLGCFGAVVLGGTLVFGLLASAAIPHCKTCGAQLGEQFPLAVLFAALFGCAVGVLATFLHQPLRRRIGGPGAAVLVAAAALLAGYLCLKPLFTWLTALD
jgi:hypothetical protein